MKTIRERIEGFRETFDSTDCVRKETANDVIDSVLDVIDSQWIHVAERLPDENSKVKFIVAKKDSSICYDTFRAMDVKLLAKLDIITHWMPMPDGPGVKG